MACFIVPAAEAVVTTAITRVIQSKEAGREVPEGTIRFSEKMKWLNGLLWGGSGLLAFEHLWHGEISPFFPFLTKAADPTELQMMLHEMATSGVGMAVLVTLVWAGMVLVTSRMGRQAEGLEKM